MVSHIDIYNPYSNLTVTSQYVSIIQEAIAALGVSAAAIDKLETQDKHAPRGIVVVAANDATKAKKCGYSPIITWIQGIIPEESHMRHSSKLRSAVLSFSEKRGLASSDFLFFVSDAMRLHFEQKYKFATANYYIMPCFNSELNKDAFFTENKYTNNIFLYAGSIDAWQCFDETLNTFQQIQAKVPEAILRIMTPHQDKAKELAEKSGIRNYTIGFAPGDKIIEEMKMAKFGFSLRNNHPVNNVSTPTKLSTYVSNGVIPIYSKYVCDFSQRSAANPYAVSADADNGYAIDEIVKLCNSDMEPETVWQAFEKAYGSYYSRAYHVKQIMREIHQKLQIGEIKND